MGDCIAEDFDNENVESFQRLSNITFDKNVGELFLGTFNVDVNCGFQKNHSTSFIFENVGVEPVVVEADDESTKLSFNITEYTDDSYSEEYPADQVHIMGERVFLEFSENEGSSSLDSDIFTWAPTSCTMIGHEGSTFTLYDIEREMMILMPPTIGIEIFKVENNWRIAFDLFALQTSRESFEF